MRMSTGNNNSSAGEPRSRAVLRKARRVLIKAGTAVVANDDGRPSLTRLGSIVEQISELVHSGVEVIFVSSGAVGMGKRLLKKQGQMKMSFLDLQTSQEDDNSNQNKDDDQNFADDDNDGSITTNSVGKRSRHHGGLSRRELGSFANLLKIEERPHTLKEKKKLYDSACAAAGQFEMMNLYQSLTDQMDVTASQILVTQADFADEQRIQNLRYAVDRLLSLGIVPIINENDAVSANQGYTADDVFSDNDSLASLCARSFGVEVLLLLTDVDGVFDRAPSDPNAKMLKLYRQETDVVEIGEKSVNGRGGMQSKIDAAVAAVKEGSDCGACVIASGTDLNIIREVLGHPNKVGSGDAKSIKGTLFCTPGSSLEKQALEDVQKYADEENENISDEARLMADAARTEARKLQSMSHNVRQDILRAIAKALLDRKDEILEANSIDVETAEKDGIALVLKKRLKLTDEKLSTLASGLNQIADMADPLGVVKSKREVADGLVLSLATVPIGVLMIIFESRPDSMPQISALALASGNGLLLKGGKEATRSNAAIHRVIGDAIESGSGGKIKRDIIGLVTSRGQVADMLSLDDVIDLVIPRGSNALVSYIKANTRIPVLGHADGVCHVYVDSSADADAASKIIVDAKTDYPSACNAMETLLLHKDTIKNGVASVALMALRKAGVKCLGGPTAMKVGLTDVAAVELKHEYGDLTCMVEVVDTMDDAIDWIHMYGSGHTECIVCNDNDVGEEFLRRVDAACVFKNASTRFADGFRFGLGAEVGISTGRIHARGPVGVEGLLTTKWQLRSEGDGKINYVAEFGGETPTKTYTHKELM